MTDNITDWKELREFKAVDLTQSFILSWDTVSESLLIDLDLYLYLCPDHGFYEEPRPAERACFRPALLEFPYCCGIRSDSNPMVAVPVATATLGHGAIAGLRRIGNRHYEINGDFGSVEIDAARPILRLKGLTA
ncbi:MAG: hypothetical protein ACE5OQ_06140 [Woeseia sp.]